MSDQIADLADHFDARIAEKDRRIERLEKALASLIEEADKLLDAGNPQDWRGMDAALNRARVVLGRP